MNQDRWRQVEAVCQRALARAPEERAAFLEEACAGDAELRREVESLMAEESGAREFLETPVAAVRLSSGTRLGPYEITAFVGAGGMGEVYEARDTRLGRTVAIKVLPPDLAADKERRRRFEHEARAVSALNHPHICTLHDIGRLRAEGASAGQGGEVEFLVLEHLEGETLAARLRKGPLPLAQALDYGAQIADALSAAHRQGIVHRDLKPANVMLTKSGAKLLDFGLAKLRAHGERPVVSAGASTTESEPLTDRGVILGTLPYMAPEQLEGKPADARTDIWALGAILYEMLAGRRAFDEDTSAKLVGAILERDPEPLTVREPLTPPAVERLVRKCVAKTPEGRWESAGDIADELRWIRDTSAAAAALSRTGRHSTARRAVVRAGAVSAAVAATATLTWIVARPKPAPPVQVRRFLIDTRPAEGLGERDHAAIARVYGLNRPSRTAIALSPDGNTLVFGGVRGDRQRLYRRGLDQDAAVALEGTDGAENPFFSPDGTWIGFWSRDALWKIRVDGGTPIELCSAPPINGASWGSQDMIAFAAAMPGRGIHEVPAGGGVPKAVTKVDTEGGESYHWSPHFLPDGETLLFTVVKERFDPRTASIVATTLTSEARIPVLDGAMDARYLPTGHVIYFRFGRLEAVPFDPVRVAVTGDAVGLIPDIMQALNADSTVIETGEAQLATSATGTLVYVAGSILPDRRNELVWVDRHGAIVGSLRIRAGPYGAPRLSPDGRRILYVSSGMNGSLWCYDVARRTSTAIPTTGPRPFCPVWMPDGRRTIYAAHVANAGGPLRMHIVPVDGSSPSMPVGGEVPAQAAELPASWMPDGQTLLFTRSDTKGAGIWQLSLDGQLHQRSPLLEPTIPSVLTYPAASPDGRWLAYVSDESEHNKVYLQRLPELSDKQQVSRDWGWAPVWRRDGQELFYLSYAHAAMRMTAVDVGPGSNVGVPRVLFEIPDGVFHVGTAWVPAYDVSADGQRFLFVRRVDEPVPPPPSQMHVVLNWFEELKAKVPVR